MTRERFIELIEKEQEALRRFLLALCCGNRQEAEDIAQDTFIKAYVASPSFVEKFKFTTWLFKIAYNTFLDKAKRAGGYNIGLEEREVKSVLSHECSDGSFEYEGLYSALSSIPLKERTSILLFYIGGYSVRETASIMNCSSGAVRVLLSRGRKRMRKLLENKNNQ